MGPMVPFGDGLKLRPFDPLRKTQVMAILNLTPDSFSDGGKHWSNGTQSDSAPASAPTQQVHDLVSASTTITESQKSTLRALPPANVAHLVTRIRHAISSGATILDIGGQSSRPNAPSVSSDTEYARIEPALLVSRLLSPTIPISIDTYRSEVFAHATSSSHPSSPSTSPPSSPSSPHSSPPSPYILNDISAGLLSPPILSLAAKTHSTVILMHMRGDPSTMTSADHTSYPSGVVPTVARELASRVAAAEAAGIRRWRIVLDPGIGFAKTRAQNLDLLRGLPELRAADGLGGLPWLIGCSRKGFIGQLLGRDDDEVMDEARRHLGQLETETEAGTGPTTVRDVQERDLGTAATVAAAVAGGADIVRVHDVRAMRDVVAVADAIYRH